METVMDSLPEFVSVTACELVLPTEVLPKLMTAGTVVKVAEAATAVPERPRDCGEPETLSAKLIAPVSVPAEDGVKTTLKERLPPAAMVAGVVRLLVPKPVPVTLAAFRTRFAFPPLEMVTG